MYQITPPLLLLLLRNLVCSKYALGYQTLSDVFVGARLTSASPRSLPFYLSRLTPIDHQNTRNLNYWDSASSFAGEVENPGKNYPRALLACVALVVFCYGLPILVGTGAASVAAAAAADGGDGVRWSLWEDGYFADIAEAIAGRWLGVWVVLAAAAANIGLFEAEMTSDALQLMGMVSGWCQRVLQIVGLTRSVGHLSACAHRLPLCSGHRRRFYRLPPVGRIEIHPKVVVWQARRVTDVFVYYFVSCSHFTAPAFCVEGIAGRGNVIVLFAPTGSFIVIPQSNSFLTPLSVPSLQLLGTELEARDRGAQKL